MKLEGSISEQNINPNILGVKYAVRGPLVQRAAVLQRELDKGVKKPFDRVVRANIGDCHALGQQPITFIRQVVGLAACPRLLSSADVPSDVRDRVREILGDCIQSSVGAYSPSQGLKLVRKRVAEYLTQRDGVPASIGDIYLGSGASDVIKAVLTMFAGDVDGRPPDVERLLYPSIKRGLVSTAVMIPIPQYPLFSGTLSELGISMAEYYLREEGGWRLESWELERTLRQAVAAGRCVRALVVINPGNPTGQVLSREDIEEIVKFAYEHNLFLMADEVYQENIVSKKFHSFKKVMQEMGAPYSGMELASFMTVSKGWAAECGLRAGVVELARLQPVAARVFSTTRAVMQCPNVLGQCALDCVMKPPAPGEPSFEQFSRETSEIHRVLTERTATAHDVFNSIPGYSCNPIDGSMFAFPRIEMPARAQEAALALNMTPDEFYCLQLLENTGVCVVPGTGFGQLPGTFHFRTTILHSREEFHHMMEAFTKFHHHFLTLYS